MATTGHSLWSILLLAVTLASCGGSPAQPSPQALSVTCPSDVARDVSAGDPLEVNFGDPTVSGGRQPVRVVCVPASGSTFALGSSTVNCTATDAGGQTATCSLHVTLTSHSQLSVTRILAFGDSITEGYQQAAISASTAGWAIAPLVVVPTETYPYYLEQMLDARYPGQDITVFNRGIGGETTGEGRARLLEEFGDTHPDLLLLLEGYNELTEKPSGPKIDDLRAMARSAQVRDIEVILATLFQVTDRRERDRPGSHEAITTMNTQIRRLASELHVGLADLDAAFGGDESLLGPDGLHPNAAGYQRIAETFRDVVIDRFETNLPPPVPAPASARPDRNAPVQSSRRSGH